MEIVSAVVGPVVNLLTVHITQKLRNLTSSAERVREMGKQMKVLEGQRDEIEEHVRENQVNNRRIPAHVPGWLEDVQNIKEEVDNISSDDIGCFDVKKKYRTGRNALRLIEDIEDLIKTPGIGIINWSDAQIPLGRVNSKSASTPGGGTHNLFKSRDKIFNDALKLLQDDDKTRVIALCGMGGVGKTTLMKQLKEAAEDTKMFKHIAELVIGKSPNLLSIQKAIAAHIRGPLTGTDVTLRAKELSKTFKVLSVERQENILVILDDLWEESNIKLEDIGLVSPLPNGVKLLLTSRNVQVCRHIAVAVDSVPGVVEVDVLKEDEAQYLFCRIAGISAEHDRDLYQKGCEIVKKCGCLPLAIKLIAANLKDEKNPNVWRRTLKRLKKNYLNNDVHEIINISYESLVHDAKAIFLLCGLFPEDSNIPIEDLTRYAWGLKLLEQVSTMEDARDSTQTSVSNLKNAYLLMDGDSRHIECVKMHDLVLAFVVATVSKGDKDGCGIIHHDDFSKWSEDVNLSQSCKQISLTCNGMSEFPSEFKFLNLSLLKLMHGNESLRFPPDFYEGMEKLQVIAFQKLESPAVPTSLRCSTNLRTLCLHDCSLTFDLTCIGDLLNLEVLSFANSGITILPSTFGNLKKLRLLDATGCYNLVIDDGVLKNMVKLEELYMIASDEERPCCFTDNNCNELAERSEHLSALELEFVGNNAHLKNMSFKKLNRFKLSVGCSLTEVRDMVKTDQSEMHSYENSLKLVTNREELLTSKINELFKKTCALYLQVNDMNTLEDVGVEFPNPRNSSFNNLSFLVVSGCAELKYLFTQSVATNLYKLEYLAISGCATMVAVIHTENNGSDVIKFLSLKYLHLAKLPNLSCFCDNANVIELPCLVELRLEGLESFTSIYPSSASSSGSSNVSGVQSFFQEEDPTPPKLEKLFVKDMKNLKEIWSPKLCRLRELIVINCNSVEVLFNMDFGEIEQLSSSLRSIRVYRCDSLVNLLPRNPMPLFNHLEELRVEECASVEVIFDIDMGCVGETDKVSSSRLRDIYLERLGKLREVWRIKDGGRNNIQIHGFEALESIRIQDCERFENIITPATTNFDMRALKQVTIIHCGLENERNDEMVESKQDQKIDVVYTPMKELNDDVSKVAFPSSYLLHTFHHLHKLVLRDYQGVEVVFEIKSPSSRDSAHDTQQPLILPYLEKLELADLERMSHVWKCNWNEFLILQKPQSLSSFHNLTTIKMKECHSIKYLFSPLMAKLLSNLKKVDIESCDGIEEVVSNRDDEDASIYSHTDTTFFPHLDRLNLEYLKNFKCVGGDAISNDIHDQLKLSQASWSLCQYSTTIIIRHCDTLSSVIPWYAVGQMQKLQVLEISDCKSMAEVFETQKFSNNKSGTETGKSLPRLEYIKMLKLPKLKILEIEGCHLLKHIFSFSTLESLAELEELEIKDCMAMEVIVDKETRNEMVVFPHLKSLILVNLPNFVGFFLGKNEFTWPTLEKVVISECPQITVFTYGQSTAPKLKFISTSLGKHSVECGLNFHVTTTSHQTQLQSDESTSSYRPATMERLPWSYHNLIEVDVNYNPSGGGQTLFSSDKLLQLQKLETVHCNWSDEIKEIFDSQTVEAEIPNLRQVELYNLTSLKYIWKSKQGTVLKFPNLTRLSIHWCNSLEYVFTCSMVGSILQLQELHIKWCKSMKVIVKGEEECDAIGNGVVEFPNLTRLSIEGCGSLEYVFTCSMVGSILQLQELHISYCDIMKVIVKGEEECDAIVNATVEFPCLKSLKLGYLKSLEGFCIGKEAFEFPSLDTLQIVGSPKMRVFTKGDLSAPKLYAINTRDRYANKRKYNIHNRLNSFMNTSPRIGL